MQFPDPVNPEEPIARYLLEKSKYRVSDLSVKFSAFKPANDGVLSVFRVEGLLQNEITDLGDEYVAGPQNRDLKGYALVTAEVFVQQNLTLTPTLEPHPRHVDVEGWSGSDDDLHGAHMLAAHAVLVLK